GFAGAESDHRPARRLERLRLRVHREGGGLGDAADAGGDPAAFRWAVDRGSFGGCHGLHGGRRHYPNFRPGPRTRLLTSAVAVTTRSCRRLTGPGRDEACSHGVRGTAEDGLRGV